MTEKSDSRDASRENDEDDTTATGPVLYHLGEDCTVEDVTEGSVYEGNVNAEVDYGVFVSLNPSVSGLIHESNLASNLQVGEEVKVRVDEIRHDGNLSLMPVHMHDYDEVYVKKEKGEVEAETDEDEKETGRERTPIEELEDIIGEEVLLEAEVVNIRQTTGPTVFTVADETGKIECAAFVGAGERAYPDVEEGDAVALEGESETRDGSVQVEASEIEILEAEKAKEVSRRFEEALKERAEPADIEPLVDSEILYDLYPRLRSIAKGIRGAVLRDRPIVVRHHADADGMASGVAVERAVVSFIQEVTDDPEAKYHLFKRMPSRAPFYEMEDVTRDLNHALKDTERHGHPLPVVLMLDNGSTGEDADAYRTLEAYDVPVYVVDHHSPDDEVEDLLEEHANPYLAGGDYSITSGMLCVELARLVSPSTEEELLHVPAVAGKGDYSEAPEMDAYVELAGEAGYGEEHVEVISEALDYESYQLKYDDGRHLINHILDVEENNAHGKLVPHLAELAEEAFGKQVDAALPNVEEITLSSGATLCTLDVENHTHKFTFPGPGKTTGRIHDLKTDEHEGGVVTVGHGPDFCVIRAEGVDIHIPEIVDELREELPSAGVDGGGHRVVGSIKFVQGMREAVLDALYTKIASAPMSSE